jgi:hypothetical protein
MKVTISVRWRFKAKEELRMCTARRRMRAKTQVSFHVKWPLKYSDQNKKTDVLVEFLLNSPTYGFLHIRSATLELSHAHRQTDGPTGFNKPFAETRTSPKIKMTRIRNALMLQVPQTPHRYYD